LFRYCQGVIDLDAEIPHRGFDLGVSEQKLDSGFAGKEITRFTDHRFPISNSILATSRNPAWKFCALSGLPRQGRFVGRIYLEFLHAAGRAWFRAAHDSPQ
jgi:hypothetical protein